METTPAGSNSVQPRKRRRLWTAIGIAAVVVAAGILGILILMSPHKTFSMGSGLQAKDTEFTVGPCSGSPDEKGMHQISTGLRSADWDQAGHLNVRYGIATNCAAPFNYGGYRLSGDKLTLEYSVFWKPVQMPDGKQVVMRTACTCGYELKYRIAGLAHKSYVFEIVEVEKR